MNDQLQSELVLEPERYELFDDVELGRELDRREFFRLAGAGLVVALLLRDTAGAQPPRRQGGFGGQQGPQDIGAWLHIGEDNSITVYTGKVEIGQNIRTALTQVVAEELHTPIERIQLVMADTALTPFDMGTFGSQTTPAMAAQLRRVAAAAREELPDLAAQEKQLDRSTLAVAHGRIVGADAQPLLEFAQVTQGKKLMKVIGPGVRTTPADQWTTSGTPVSKVDGRAFVTGAHLYASDIRRPQMLFGKV